MPVSPPASFTALKNKLFGGDPWIWLLELRSPTDGPITDVDGTQTILRATARTDPVEFGTNPATGAPLVWKPWPIKLGEVADDTQGNLNEIELTFANALGAADALMNDNDYLRGHRVYIHLTHAAQLSLGVPAFTIPTTVINSSVDWQAITLRLSAFAFLDFTVPQKLMTRKCGWAYRGKGCAFIGDPGNVELGPCTFDIEACRLRGTWEDDNGLPVLHPKNFGGFPALLAGPVFTVVP